MTEFPKTYCPLFFNHLTIHPDSVLRPCCRNSTRKNFLKVNSIQDVQKLFYSDVWNNYRHNSLNNIEIDGCSSCRNPNNSLQKKMQSRYGLITTPKLSYLEIRIGRICNLACITCDVNLSTRWYKDNKRLPEKFVKDFQHDNSYCSSLSSTDKPLEGITELKITGGEPLISPIINFWQDLCKNNPNVKIVLASTISLANVCEFNEIYDFYKSINFDFFCLQFVINRPFLDIRNIPNHIKQEICSLLEPNRFSKRILEFMSEQAKNDFTGDFLEYIRALENIRGIQFKSKILSIINQDK